MKDVGRVAQFWKYFEGKTQRIVDLQLHVFKINFLCFEMG